MVDCYHSLHTDLDSKLNEIAKPEGFGKSRSRKSRLRGPPGWVVALPDMLPHGFLRFGPGIRTDTKNITTTTSANVARRGRPK